MADIYKFNPVVSGITTDTESKKSDIKNTTNTENTKSDIGGITSNNKVIDINRVTVSRYVPKELIGRPTDQVKIEIAAEHTSEPIKDLADIDRISKYLIENRRYRDNMLFIVGINFGLRVSDLLQLRFCHLIDENFVFRNTFPILEKKTKNTRKTKRNRYITINDAVVEAVMLYLKNTLDVVSLNDFMFRSNSNNRCDGEPMTRCSVDRILKGIASDLKLNVKVSTHTLRKTFAYHQMVMSNNDPRKLLLLQKMFGHSSAAQTLDYIGITGEEIEKAYMELNLGSENNYLTHNVVRETSGVC